MAWLDRDGVRLHYETHGAPGGHTPALLTHGFSASATMWGSNAYVERTAATIDARGFDALRDSPEVALAHHRRPGALALAARGIMAQRDASVIESLAGVDVPALVVVGADDAPFLRAADYMAARIPGAKKVVIDGAGHAANLDRPEVFNAAVSEFLEGL